MCSRKYINLGIETSYPIPSNLEGMKQHNCMNLKWKKKKKYNNHCACGYANWHTKNHSHGLANVAKPYGKRESEREKPINEHTHGDDRKCRVKI
ncbi:hypothetical protein E1A91_D07G084800v1 [Gossypium mustelinum]|uniref:Uncharacterized protein n=1 Tax=Gossypium mustelinum TaxID=34275 RepID=A0A5D2U7T5_GOSMU|nr:hypothetical protein E1A91_D07G084800v1 [Gossypium mustelinum]